MGEKFLGIDGLEKDLRRFHSAHTHFQILKFSPGKPQPQGAAIVRPETSKNWKFIAEPQSP